jgi:hypothetical protein
MADETDYDRTLAQPPPPHFLFTSVPLQGHFHPTLCVAAALAKRARVTFLAFEEKREAVAAANVAFRSLGAFDPALERDLNAQLAAVDKRLVPIPRRAPRMGSIVFPFYEEHIYAPLLEAVRAEVLAAAESAAARESAAAPAMIVLVCEHASLAAHDVAETLSLPLALLWQLPLFYSLCMAGQGGCAVARHPRVPVELPGVVLPARMSAWQRLAVNSRLKCRQMSVLCDEYVPKRHAARARSGAAAASAAGAGGGGWRGQAPFAPAVSALPRPVVHVVSGSALLEPARAVMAQGGGRCSLPPGWFLSGPQGVVLDDDDPSPDAAAADDPPNHHHHHHHSPSVRRLLAAAEREGAPVLYVAFGTLATFDREGGTIAAMARAFAALVGGGGGGGGSGAAGREQPSSSSPPTTPYVLWSLAPAGQDHLPGEVLASLDPLARVVRSEEEEGDGEGEVQQQQEEEPPPPPPPRLLVVPRVRQQALLSHGSVRLFLSHCGLNSTCEALMRGVPLVCWPLFADQHINASHAANEGAGVVVPDDGPDGTTTAAVAAASGRRSGRPGGRRRRSGNGNGEEDEREDGSSCGNGGGGSGDQRGAEEGTRRDARAIEAILRGALADEGMLRRARALGERMRAEAAGNSGAEVAADVLLRAFGHSDSGEKAGGALIDRRSKA